MFELWNLHRGGDFTAPVNVLTIRSERKSLAMIGNKYIDIFFSESARKKLVLL